MKNNVVVLEHESFGIKATMEVQYTSQQAASNAKFTDSDVAILERGNKAMRRGIDKDNAANRLRMTEGEGDNLFESLGNALRPS